MKPWMRVYTRVGDWRQVPPPPDDIYRRKALEVRFGALGWQAGLMLPRLGFAVWRGYEPVASFRWFPRTGPKVVA